MELLEGNIIWAIKIDADADWVLKHLKDGEARFGWGYYDKEEEVFENVRNGYLKRIIPGDILVYTDIPCKDIVTAVKVIGEYYYFKNSAKGFKKDYRNCIEVDKDSIFSFNRNDKEVEAPLSGSFKFRGMHNMIHHRGEFKKVLQAHKDGKLGC